MNESALPKRIAHEIQARFDIAEVAKIKPGMSGATVFRCDSRDGQRYALKRFPRDAERARIEEVHRVVLACRIAGCDVLPRLHSLNGAETIACADGFWEFSDWMPGNTVGAGATLELAETGAAAIASFHAASRGLGCISQPPPAVLDRLRRVCQLESSLAAALRIDPTERVSPRLADALRKAQSILYQSWRGAADEIVRSMNPYARRPMLTQYVLRDVHREHILFDHHQVTGLIDFDAVRRDTPAIDLARWAGSLLVARPHIDALWEAVLAGFQRESPSMNQQIAYEAIHLAKRLHFATSWISLANWVVWVLVQGRSFPAGEEAVAERILEWTQLTGQET